MTEELKRRLDLILAHNLKHPSEEKGTLLRIPVLIARGEMAIAFQGKPNKEKEKRTWKRNCERLAASLPPSKVRLGDSQKTVDPFEGIKKAFPSERKPESKKITEILKEMAGALRSITKMDLGDVDTLEMLKVLEEHELIPDGSAKSFAKEWGKKGREKPKRKSQEIGDMPHGIS